MGPDQHFKPGGLAALATSDTFARVLPRDRSGRTLARDAAERQAKRRARAAERAGLTIMQGGGEAYEPFPEPKPLERTNLAVPGRPACAAEVEYLASFQAHRAACPACHWKGPNHLAQINAQDDADDHNGTGPDLPTAA